MTKALRIFAGLILIGLILYASSRADQDCAVGPQVYENCVWLAARDSLGLPQTKLGRAVTLELVGLALLASLYVTLRCVFPRAGKPPKSALSATPLADDSGPSPPASPAGPDTPRKSPLK